ncbi:hypothetical protein J6590_031984 [Homalodisca vitripennis]|nr:hypothetical protein J6590_031984 [Homalodisca vitripennis]
MNGADGSLSVGEGNEGTRKRRVTGGKRKSEQITRYAAPKRALVFVPCKHNSKRFTCVKIRPNDIKSFKEEFYKVPDKKRQDNIIASLIHTTQIKRHRPRPANKNKKKKPGPERK